MSSQPVFKVPQPVPVRYVVTAEELKEVRGKIRSLSKILELPRRTLPGLQPYISALLAAQNAFINLSKSPYSEEDRACVEDGMITMKNLEDIVIRVIVQGEDPAHAHRRILNRLNSSDDPNDTISDVPSSSECASK